MSALIPAISTSKLVAAVESPQSTRCLPSSQTSPRQETGTSGTSGATSSSVCPSVAPSSPASKSASSSGSKPVSDKLNDSSFSAISSTCSMASSQPALSAIRLSAITSARRWVDVRWSSTMTGATSSPSLRAAASLPCPAMMTASLSTKIGLVKPNSTMLAAIWAICASECVRGFRA